MNSDHVSSPTRADSPNLVAAPLYRPDGGGSGSSAQPNASSQQQPHNRHTSRHSSSSSALRSPRAVASPPPHPTPGSYKMGSAYTARGFAQTGYSARYTDSGLRPVDPEPASTSTFTRSVSSPTPAATLVSPKARNASSGVNGHSEGQGPAYGVRKGTAEHVR